MATLTTPASPPGGSPARPFGVIAQAQPAPEGWELGGISVSAVCPDPIVEDGCVILATHEAGEPTPSVFPLVRVRQGSGCSTLAGDRSVEARDSLNEGTDFALGLILADHPVAGVTSLADADTVGDFPTIAGTLAALLAVSSNGLPLVIHATPAVAVYLMEAGLLIGGTHNGIPVIVSDGYGADLQLWVTGRVWAAVGPIETFDAVDRFTNKREAWAERDVIVGFNPCVNVTATFTPTP